MSDFTENWTTAAAKEIVKMINQAVVDEWKACAKIADECIGQQLGDLDLAKEIAVRTRSGAIPE